MARTTKNERLSLRDAVLRWCDPVLVAAVQAAEASFPEDQVVALYLCHLGGAAPPQRDLPELDHRIALRIQEELGPAWQALLTDFRNRILVSRIQLAGASAAANAQPISVPIPLADAHSYQFDFSTDTVTWFRGSWRTVTASLNTQAASLDHPADQPLALKTAMLTWCDEALVDEYETADLAGQVGRVLRGSPPPGHERLFAGLSSFDFDRAEERWRGRLAPATTALEADFRARIADGRIQLTGLQMEPVLATKRSRLSPVWAERMKFDWQKRVIRVGSAMFDDVVGSAKAVRPQATSKAGDTPARVGRPAFPMADMVAIARTRLDVRGNSNKREVNLLLQEFRQLHPLVKPPTVRTIKDHVAEIYAAAAKDAVPLKPPN